MADPNVVKLKHPIKIGEAEPITELKFRRGKMGDAKGVTISLAGVDLGIILEVAGRLCEQPQMVIERIDQDDIGEVVAIVGDFFARCLPGGLADLLG